MWLGVISVLLLFVLCSLPTVELVQRDARLLLL
jgi:hypothetical protein